MTVRISQDKNIQYNFILFPTKARQWLADEDTSLFEPLPEGLEIDDVTSLEGQLKQIDCQLAIGKFLDILSFDSFMLTYSTALNEDSTVS